MIFSFENQGTNTLMVYTVTPEDSLDSMTLGMLTHNKIPGLAATTFSQMDTEKYLKYNVSAKISVKQFFSGPVNRKRLMGVFNGIVDAMLSAEEYMIDSNSILLDMEYIFADVSTCETVLICLPIEHEGENVDLGTFFKNIMFSTQFDQTENCDHVAQIINYLNSAPVFSLVDFKELLKKLEGAQKAPVNTSRQSSRIVTERQPQSSSSHGATDLRNVTPPPSVSRAPAPAAAQQPVQAASPAGKTPLSAPYAVPGSSSSSTPAVAESAAPVDDGEKISFMYLMQHYNKENAAKYKAQQEAEKAQKAAGKGKHEKPAKEKKSKEKAKSKSSSAASFAVPGGSSGFAFAVPGQQAEVPSESSFAQPAAAPAQQAAVPVQQAAAAPVQQAAPSRVQAPVQQAAAAPAQQPVYQAPEPAYTPPPMDFGNTTVLSQSRIGETTVLVTEINEQKPQPYLVRRKNNEKIPLNKPVFRIGKERSYVDYFVGDNPAVSRSHANIITRDDKYFIVDTNSKNHTYVNGQMIQSNDEVPIEHGSILVLANESFDFKLY